jgi:pimeloyl-ACP methyl ester carboxylesterase
MRVMWKTLAVTGVTAMALHKLNHQIEERTGEWNPTHYEELFYFPWKEGHVAYHVKGSGQPVLLVHGIGTGASSFEWRKNIDSLAQEYKVYALDLLGFGLSDKPDISYIPETYIELIKDFILHVIQQSVHLVASSSSAAYTIKLAYSESRLIKQMILICPTGLDQTPNHKEVIYAQLARQAALTVPILNTSLYYLVASRMNISSFLRNYSYAHEENLTTDIIESYYSSAHYGGRHAGRAVNAFLRGDLDVQIEEEWSKLQQPCLLVWGEDAQINPVSEAITFKDLNPACSLELFKLSGLLPHDEEAYLFNRVALNFLNQNQIH